jgi:cellulose synthase/poly-beta-1,6-N-acetylglucosamine synthase-like glycosyltransferase
MEIIFTVISGLILFFLVFPFLTVLFSRFFKESLERRKSTGHFDYGCIITAYKNVEITLPLVQSLLKQKYTNFHIYLVADECMAAPYAISDPRLTVLFPEKPLRLKAKSIIEAIERFVRPHDYTIIFDADNVAHPHFLEEINRYANQGYRSIQGQRTAKNLDTIYACADSTGEFYKNYVERYVPYLIGSSSVISGSGMAVASTLYKAYLDSPEIQKGKEKWKKMLQEDKILQNFLLRKNEKIVFAKDAIVYDEKVRTATQVETQRSRWLYSYFQNLPNSSGLIGRGLLNLSWNQLLFGLITIAPPLFVLLFSAMLFTVLGLFIQPLVSIALVIGLGVFVLNIFWTLHLSKVPKAIWKAIWGIPFFIFKQFTALFKMVNPNKNFKHSEHTKSVEIEELLRD